MIFHKIFSEKSNRNFEYLMVEYCHLAGARHWFLILILACLIVTTYSFPAQSQEGTGLPHPAQRITSHPEQDISPSLSPNGKWLLFASHRTGNWDLYVKPTEQGPPIRMTSDLTDEHSPVWSNDGKSIAFVSNREDALGEIYTARISLGSSPKIGKIRRITWRLGYEGEPDYSPDGKILVYTSDRAGVREIWSYHFGSGEERLLIPGTAVSPDFSRQGDLAFIKISDDFPGGEVFVLKNHTVDQEAEQITFSNKVNSEPSFAPDGKSLTIARVVRDSDKDGILTPQDNFSLWIIPVDSANSRYKSEFPLTVENGSNRQGDWGSDGRIYYTNLRDNVSDIFVIQETGIFGRRDSGDKQLELAEQYENYPEYYPLGLEAVRGYFPASGAAGRALYLKAEYYYRAGNARLAQSFYRQVLRDYGQYEELSYFAEIGLLKLISGFREPGDGSAGESDNPSGFLTAVEGMLSRNPPASAAVEIKMLMGNTLLQIGVFSEALQVYQEIIEQYKEFPDYAAQAQCRIGEVFQRFGGENSEVVQSYLKVLQKYPEVVIWNRYAIDKIFGLELKKDIFLGCQNIIGKYREYPQLTLTAKSKMGDKLAEAGHYDLASAEYEQIIDFAGDNPIIASIQAQASFALTEIIFRRGDFIRATEILERVLANIPDYQEEARAKLYQVYIERGGEMLKSRDPQLAKAMFDKARRIFPQKLEGHRGYIAAVNKLDKGSEVFTEYSASVKVHPDDAAALYCQGLSLSYISETDFGGLQKSTEIIKQALELDYSMIPGHLTLSYNYQAMERLKAAGNIKVSIPRKIADFTYEVLVEFLQAVTFQSEPPEFSGYELAINSLSHAILLNDEGMDASLEAALYRNMGNCYYALGEFGFDKALEAYEQMLKFDGELETETAAAVINERMGRAAMYGGDFSKARVRLAAADSAYTALGEAGSVFRLLLLQAENELLYGDGETSNEYFSAAVEQAEISGIAAPGAMYFSDAAFNWYAAGEWAQALAACDKALTEYEGKKIQKSKANRPKIRFSALGFDMPLSIPLPSMAVGGLNIGGSRAIDGFDAADIKSLALSIKAETLEKQAEDSQAEGVLQEKIELAEVKKNYEEAAAGWNNLAALDYRHSEYSAAVEKWLKSTEYAKKARLEGPVYSNVINLQSVLSYLTPGSELRIKAAAMINKVNNSILAEAEDSPQRLLFAEAKGLILANSGGRDFSRGKDYLNSGTADSVVKGYLLIERAVKHWLEAEKRFDRISDDKNSLRMEVNLAAVSHLMGNYGDAERRLKEALIKAEKEYYQDLAWEILKLLGDIHYQMGGSTVIQAEMEYERAIEIIVEADAKEMDKAPSQKAIRDDLMQSLIGLKLNMGKAEEAFQTAELQSAMEFTEKVSRRDFTVKGERRKYYWSGGGGNINYLRKETARLREELYHGRLKKERRSEVIDSLNTLQEEYKELLKKAVEEDAEFAAMFKPAAPSMQEVRKILTEEELLIRFYRLQDSLIVGCLTNDDFTWNYFSLTGKTEDETLAEVFQGLKDYLEFYPKLMITGEADCFSQAFQNYIFNNRLLYETYQVTQGHSTAELYFARGKRNIGGKNLVTAGVSKDRLRRITGYNVISIETVEDEADFAGQLKQGDILIIEGDFSRGKEVVINQGYTVNIGEKKLRIANYRHFGWELTAPIAILLGTDLREESGGFLRRSLLFAGVTGIIGISQDAPDSVKQVYIEAFLRYLPDNSPIGAHQAALQEIPVSAQYAVFWGDGGMTTGEKLEFAKSNFQKTVMLGNKNLQEKSYEWAGHYYTQAMEMAKRMGDKSAELNLLQLQIRAAYYGKDWNKAAGLQAESIDRSVSPVSAGAWENLAYFRLQAGDFTEALESLDKAGEMYIANGEYAKAVQAYNSLAAGLESKNSYEMAISCVEKNREIYKKYAMENAEDTEILLAKLNFEAGMYTVSADILEDLLRKNIVSPHNLFFAHLLYARSKFSALDYYAATEYFSKALELADKDSLAQKGEAYQGLADVYYRLSDYDSALDYIDSARATIRDINGGAGYLSYNTEALTLGKMGRTQAAGEAFVKAIDLAEKSSDRKSEAVIRRNYAAYLLEGKDYQRGLFQVNLAWENDRAVRDTSGQMNDMLIAAGIMIKTGDLAKAADIMEQTAGLATGKTSPLINIKRRLTQGYMEYSLEHYQKAEEIVDSVLKDKMCRLMPEMNWRANYLRGLLCKKLKKSEEALNWYFAARESIKELTCPRDDAETMTVVIDDVWSVYERGVEEAMTNSDYSGGREIMEERDALRRKFGFAERGIKLRSRQVYSWEEGNLRSSMEALQRMIEIGEGGKADSIAAKLDSVRLKHNELLNTIQNWDGIYYSGVSGNHLFTTNKNNQDKLAQYLLLNNTGIIEYAVFPSIVYGCVTTEDTVVVRRLDISPGNLQYNTDILSQSIEGRLNIEVQSKMFYEKLFQPFEAVLSQKSGLVIIPDAAMWRIPFETLTDRQGETVLDKWAVSLDFSLDAVLSSIDFIAGGSGDRILFAAPETAGMQKLEFAEKEIESIAFTLPEAEIYKEAVINGDDLKRKMENSKMAHLACHGKAESDSPLDYRLMLSPEGKTGWQARDLYGGDTDAEFYYFSACGKGIFGDEEYMDLSLPNALKSAGAGAVISSLWKVDDLAAAALAKRFYREYVKGESKAEALRKAKQFMRERINPHPSYWAAFQLYGNREGSDQFNRRNSLKQYSGITQ